MVSKAGKPNIAVVNDDTAFLELMHDLLSDEGYDVLLWKEGSNAYQKLKEEQPDLIILDIRIEQPEKSVSILELLKLDPQTRRIPLIVCSADAAALLANQENYRRHGVRSLPKPFDLDDLLSMINSMLGEREHDPEQDQERQEEPNGAS